MTNIPDAIEMSFEIRLGNIRVDRLSLIITHCRSVFRAALTPRVKIAGILPNVR